MIAESRFRVNAPDVIDDSVEGEALIVHLGTGAYYSADGTGDVAWRLLAAGHSVSAVIDSLSALTSTAPGEIGAGVSEFVARLTAEGLLLPAPAETDAAPVELPAALPFAAPKLNKYTDMEALLLLDPVHDVDEGGWPIARTADDIGSVLRG